MRKRNTGKSQMSVGILIFREVFFRFVGRPKKMPRDSLGIDQGKYRTIHHQSNGTNRAVCQELYRVYAPGETIPDEVTLKYYTKGVPVGTVALDGFRINLRNSQRERRFISRKWRLASWLFEQDVPREGEDENEMYYPRFFDVEVARKQAEDALVLECAGQYDRFGLKTCNFFEWCEDDACPEPAVAQKPTKKEEKKMPEKALHLIEAGIAAFTFIAGVMFLTGTTPQTLLPFLAGKAAAVFGLFL